MVERLKSAIEKARAQRDGQASTGTSATAASAQSARANDPAKAATAAAVQQAAADAASRAIPNLPAPVNPADLEDWSKFEELTLDDNRLRAERIVARSKSDPAHRSFDMLRTRVLRVFREKKWNKLGVVSPTKGVGKTVVITNLAFSLARQPDTRVLLFDLDLAAPRMSNVLAPGNTSDMPGFLKGAIPPEQFLRRASPNLLVGLNQGPVPGSSELAYSAKTGEVLQDTIKRTNPTIVLFDVSPVLASDDALNVLAYADCALMIVGAGQTTATEIADSEKLIGEWTNLLGLVLNGSEEKTSAEYAY